MNAQKIAVLTDTGTNTPADFMATHDVRAVELRINYSDGSSYRSGTDISAAELVARFAQEIPKTSLPSPAQIREALDQAKADGYEKAVFVTISAGLSATNQTVELVASQMDDFPVSVVNTRSIGIAAGLVVMAAVEMVESGMPFELLGPNLDALSRKTRVYFSTKTLVYLRHGGRISEAVYRLGTMLNIKPVITCDKGGYYVVAKKTRGWERSLDGEVDLTVKHAKELGCPVRLALCCSEGNDHFDELEAKLRTKLADAGIDVAGDVVRSNVSPDLLVHTGPDLVGMGILPSWNDAPKRS